MSSILTPQQPYTFSKIFDLKIEADELVAKFGYTLQNKPNEQRRPRSQ